MCSLIYLVILVIDVVVIMDVFKQSWDTGKKILWTIVVLLLPLVGPLAYWFAGRK